MNTVDADQKNITQSKAAKKRKLIGDRGDYFLNRIEGETGANVPVRSAILWMSSRTKPCDMFSWGGVKIC